MAEQQDSFVTAAEMLCEEVREVVLSLSESKRAAIQEIRLRVNKPLALTDGTATLFLEDNGRVLYSISDKAFRTTQRHLYDTFRRLCGYAVYSVENEVRHGYLTVKGGHRVGLCGTAVLTDGKLSAMSEVSSLNVRIARQVFGVAEDLIRRLYPFQGGVLLVGAPASGKTTMLRDMARCLSLGVGCRMMRTTVIDERGELSGMCHGIAANDLGLCDILNGYPKGEGILQAIRALSPQVIVCDELGTDEDCQLAAQGFHAGAMMIASLHAPDYQALLHRPQAKKLLQTGAFRTIAMLQSSDRPCTVAAVHTIEEGEDTVCCT